jgi:hypothetical protein
MRGLLLAGAAVALAAACTMRTPVRAMPIFAQAYGVDCQTCHIEVPALNAYGRYVQRTMYAALDRKTLARGIPVWIGESAFFDSQDPNEPHRLQLGNLAVHGAGFASNDLTYHVQQWLSQNDQPGGLDTLWLSYNRIFGRQAHLVVGKMPPPGPSFYSQWDDIAPFATPQLTVGEHVFSLAANRWGTKFSYTREALIAEAGWFGSSADLNGATDFSAALDKSVQWHAAYAPVAHRYQIGLYGTSGVLPLAAGGVDRYSAAAGYVQLDPSDRAPGAIAVFQRGWDGHPGAGLPAAASHAFTAEVFWRPFRRHESLLGLRREVTSDGLGTITRSTDVDFSFRVARYLHATIEAGAQSHASAAWRYQLWWTTPLRPAIRH